MTQRHQRGWLKKEKRSQGETWVLFFRTVRKSDGKRVENKIPIGLLKDFSSKSCAWAEVERQHLHINQVDSRGGATFADLAHHYAEHELIEPAESIHPKAHTTIRGFERDGTAPWCDLSNAKLRVFSTAGSDWNRGFWHTRFGRGQNLFCHVHSLLPVILSELDNVANPRHFPDQDVWLVPQLRIKTAVRAHSSMTPSLRTEAQFERQERMTGQFIADYSEIECGRGEVAPLERAGSVRQVSDSDPLVGFNSLPGRIADRCRSSIR